jgi:hypothetical protein
MSDWKTRHPFTVGQKVYPRIGGRAERLGLAQPRTVAMRGESDRGLWLALSGIAYEFPIDDFTAVPPMAPAIDADETEGEITRCQ